MESKGVKDKVVIVTGAARGIGLAIAKRFAVEGALVVVADINAEGARSVAESINGTGGRAIAVTTDVSDDGQVKALLDQTVEHYGTMDVLVNNAALVAPNRHFLEADKPWWDRFIAVNLTGSFLCGLRAAQIMARKRKGSIINLSSGGASRAHRAFVAYDATKGGIEAMTRAMSLDLGPYGVRVNALVPGSINTQGYNREERKLRGVNIPLGRIGEPDDLTGAALFLASDDSSYITGQRIVVDGGMAAQQRSATVDIFPTSEFPTLD